MRSDPIFDPFVEAGYLGYSLRVNAHRQADNTYQPSLEIRDFRYGTGELLYDCTFKEVFSDAAMAIERAMGRGQQIIDDLLTLMNHDERIEI